ncbi:NAD(P)/FAD-dependent oxidoreductase [Thetidibacter halocola]|uniref:NAD(P)/FAD-dependent oxidoreductase n=1 Tax=Thetidibacter halocola TaxID=2827239 RepID=A0A8J7WDP3_9RHOB|nr:NAD(P)/FAD-dependent oxidoreductase [Thetidibacter halocola]MBS0123294.1 NAD(P)/FAD-dependent oxidoreductase [Thetidibacter halocola]
MVRAQDTDDLFDAAVIGGGVIGCAIARRLTLEGWRTVLIEKAADILDGASKGNSAILHTGFDAPEGSVEQACIVEGYAEYRAIHERLNLPLDEAGALVIAWTDAEAASLPALIAQARTNGVTDVSPPLTPAQVLALEPNLNPSLRSAFRVPRESLIDPWSAPLAYILQAVENGAVLLRGTEVTGGAFDGSEWRLETTSGVVRARVAINCAGNWGDVVDERLFGARDFTLRPRKGQFVVYDKPASRLARHILLPVPNKITKGVVVCRTVFGNLLVGPTAEDQDDREAATLVPETLEALKRRGAEILPALAREEVTAIYAGLRPATEFKDYRIKAHEGRNAVTVGGIRSTGLSSALGTAAHVWRLCAGLLDRAALPDPLWPRVPNLAEALPRGWQAPDNGGILCHCERVTRAEVEAALSGPVPAGSLAGLKRRTRVTMGRCQGNWCAATLAQVTRGRLPCPMAEAVE